MHLKNGRSATALATGAVIYAGLMGWLLASSTSKLYGFSVLPGLHDLLAAVSQVCPLFAAFFFLALDTSARKLVGPMAGPALLGTLFTGVVLVVVKWITRENHAGLLIATQAWSYGALWIDLLLIAVFTSFVRWLAGGPVLAMVLFVGYVVAIFYLGPRLGATAFIGFGSTPPCSLTVYSNRPLGDEDAWLFRLYWALCAAVLLALRFDARRKFLRPYASIGTVIAFGFTGMTLWRQTHAAPMPMPAPSLSQNSGRPALTDYKLHLDYYPHEQRLAVEGELQFQNTSGAPLSTVWLEAPHLVTLRTLKLSQPVELVETGVYREVKLKKPLKPGDYFVLNFTGDIQATDTMGRARAKAKLLESSFFLFHSDLLFAARRPGCLDGKGTDCGGLDPRENYLLTDRATGQVAVHAPAGWVPVSIGKKEMTGIDQTTFSVSRPRLVSFLVACAPFTQAGVPGVSVFQSPDHSLESTKIATIARDILGFYGSQFPPLATDRDLRVVVTPDYLGEAIAFEGLLAVSDRVIDSRAADNTGPSSMVEFVMAHELAHQWWGYQLVPARAPGRAFAVESFAQFSAYCYAANRKILSREDAARNEERNYRWAKAHLAPPGEETPLGQIEKEDYLAYHKGPYVLLSLDAQDDQRLLSSLGGILRKYSANAQEAVPPRLIVEDLLASLKPPAQSQGRTWLLQTAGEERKLPNEAVSSKLTALEGSR